MLDAGPAGLEVVGAPVQCPTCQKWLCPSKQGAELPPGEGAWPQSRVLLC